MAELNFTLQGGRYAAEYISTGATVVQIQQEKGDQVIVYAYLDGMRAASLVTIGNMGATPNYIFTVNAPAGVNVRIESLTKVTKAQMLEVTA